MAPDHGGRPESNLAVLRVAQSPAETGGLCPGFSFRISASFCSHSCLVSPSVMAEGIPHPGLCQVGTGQQGGAEASRITSAKVSIRNPLRIKLRNRGVGG
jgi:hypothetical protein